MTVISAARADLALAERDPAVPSMAAIFEPAALVADLAPGWGATGAELRYLRYKPGVSLVATLAVHLPDGETRLVQAVALGAGPGAADKLEKIVAAGERDDVGRGAVVDAGRALALVDATADRALPGVRRLLRRTEPGAVTTLVYKPGRRWVARHGPAGATASIVKVHRPDVLPGALARHQALAAHGLPVAPLIGHHPRRGTIVTAYLPGTPLDAVPGGAHPALSHPELWHATGGLLATVHAAPVPPQLPGTDRAAALEAAVTAVAAIAPEHETRARRTADAVVTGLAGRQVLRVVHGDFSADQVLARPDLLGRASATSAGTPSTLDQAPLTLLDLDRSRVDDPLEDLGSWYAHEVVTGPARVTEADPVVVLGPLLTGYRAAGGAVDARALRLYAAAALLQRAVEPFRRRLPGWPERVDELLTTADGLVTR